MTWRLLVLFLSAAPQNSVSPWSTVKGVDSRELRFSDRSGEHVVRFTLGAERKKQQGEAILRSRELLVTHAVGKKEVWRAKDFVEACEFDLSLEVVEGSIRLTDLDEDGEPEVSFLYRLGCRSDVSPLTAKLLLYEGGTKYALRGQSKEQVGEAEFAGGDFTADKAFGQAPKAFLEFATGQWRQLVVEVHAR